MNSYVLSHYDLERNIWKVSLITHTWSKVSKYTLCGAWVKTVVWNFKCTLWNFTLNFECTHHKICILQGVKVSRIMTSKIYDIICASDPWPFSDTIRCITRLSILNISAQFTNIAWSASFIWSIILIDVMSNGTKRLHNHAYMQVILVKCASQSFRSRIE